MLKKKKWISNSDKQSEHFFDLKIDFAPTLKTKKLIVVCIMIYDRLIV